jgi:nickel/cobalt transporter (NiCoT) family protein
MGESSREAGPLAMTWDVNAGNAMLAAIKRFYLSTSPQLRFRLIAIYAALAVLNVGAWIAALIAFRDKPALLGVALVVYSLGLRHAVDADHIAAIDNVTRKLMQARQRPVAVGFFFAMGHSTLVILGVAAVSLALAFLDGFEALKNGAAVFQTLVSALFLFAIAAMNIVIFLGIYRNYRHVRRGGAYVEEDLDLLLARRGFLARIFRPLFRLVTRSWHMFPLGFLFGLGFDTTTEVAVFGFASAQASQGVPFPQIMLLPILFAAGMALVDTSDGVMMLGAYDWAFVKPIRKLFYNLTITLVSVLVALLIGGIEALGLVGDQLGLTGGFWLAIGRLNDNFNSLGFVIIGVFLAAWIVSFAIYKAKGLDEIDVTTPV